MAELHGNVGGVYYQASTITATTIAFVNSNPDTITDSGNGFVTAGFAAGQYITASGTSNNNDTFLIDTGGVAAGTLTLVAGDTLTAESAGSAFTIKEAPAGTELLGFFNWSVDSAIDTNDVTSFDDGSARTFITSLTNWTATAEQYWQTTQDIRDWIGTSKIVRFFTRYTAAPNTTNAYYYEGTGLITSIGHNEPVDDLVTQTLTFQGTGALTLTTRTTAWAT